MNDADLLFEDIARLCRAVGIFDGAQDRSPHEVMVRCIERLEAAGPSGQVVTSCKIEDGLSVVVLRTTEP
jgi:hypothetical protein